MVIADAILRRLNEDPRALPRLITLVENEDPSGLAALEALYPQTGNTHIVGISGPPGAGKSTLIAALVGHIRETGRRVAVVAVDPSSTISGGAVLGDRIRMMDRHGDSGVFIRSMASRGRQGGLAWATAELVHVLDAAGFGVILIETVGTGQDGTDIARLVDSVIVVQAPGLGDGVQAIKAGLLEIGDIIVVNKADQPGAAEAVRVLRTSLQLGHTADGRAVPVLATDALSGEGVAALLGALDDHLVWLEASGERCARRQRGAQAEVLAGMRVALDRELQGHPERAPVLAEAIARVARRELTPRRAVEEALAGLKG